jgi:hypothetical protein
MAKVVISLVIQRGEKCSGLMSVGVSLLKSGNLNQGTGVPYLDLSYELCIYLIHVSSILRRF